MTVKPLKAVILAGGFATRLRPISCSRPKVLFPIVNKPLLQWTFERLAKHSVKEAIMAVNYQTEIMIKQYGVHKAGVHVKYSRDPLKKPLGTGGPIKKAENLIGPESLFLVLNGDIFADVDYDEIMRKHEKTGAVATLALHRVKNPSRYGVAELAKNGQIERFLEKPKSAPSALINAGAYVFSGEIFKYLPGGVAVSLEREVFPILAEKGLLYGHSFEGTWTDIGKPEDYVAINKELLRRTHAKQPKVNRKTEILSPVAIDRKVTVGDQSKIGPYTILGMSVSIGKNVQIRDTIVFPSTIISDSCTIEGAIIGENVRIGKRVKIGRGCIIADHAKIRDNVSLAERVSVCPANEVSKSVLTPNRNC